MISTLPSPYMEGGVLVKAGAWKGWKYLHTYCKAISILYYLTWKSKISNISWSDHLLVRSEVGFPRSGFHEPFTRIVSFIFHVLIFKRGESEEDASYLPEEYGTLLYDHESKQNSDKDKNVNRATQLNCQQ